MFFWKLTLRFSVGLTIERVSPIPEADKTPAPDNTAPQANTTVAATANSTPIVNHHVRADVL